MPIHYEYSADTNILEARAIGTITAEDNAQSNARVRAEMDNHPRLKLLVDTREADIAVEPAVMIRMMDGFYALVGSKLPVAIVTLSAPESTNPMLAKTKAFIAGAQMQFFESTDEARAWLERL